MYDWWRIFCTESSSEARCRCGPGDCELRGTFTSIAGCDGVSRGVTGALQVPRWLQRCTCVSSVVEKPIAQNTVVPEKSVASWWADDSSFINSAPIIIGPFVITSNLLILWQWHIVWKLPEVHTKCCLLWLWNEYSWLVLSNYYLSVLCWLDCKISGSFWCKRFI